MMGVLDYAWGRPDPDIIRSKGFTGVMRYLSHTAGKNLSRSEADKLISAGLDIGVVWETTAARSLDGYFAGFKDGSAAKDQAATCGMPDGRPVYFAVDFDVTSSQMSKVMSYLDGAITALGALNVGIYGGYTAVHFAMNNGIKWGWQTYAWSGGQWDPRAQLQQYSNEHTIDGVGCDYNRIVKADYGQWPLSVVPKPHPNVKDKNMPNGLLNSGEHSVTPIAIAAGSATHIGFMTDETLQGFAVGSQQLRVAYHDVNGWHVAGKDEVVGVSSAWGQITVTFADPATTNGVSVERLNGTAEIAYVVA